MGHYSCIIYYPLLFHCLITHKVCNKKESIVIKKTPTEILMEIHILDVLEHEKSI